MPTHHLLPGSVYMHKHPHAPGLSWLTHPRRNHRGRLLVLVCSQEVLGNRCSGWRFCRNDDSGTNFLPLLHLFTVFVRHNCDFFFFIKREESLTEPRWNSYCRYVVLSNLLYIFSINDLKVNIPFLGTGAYWSLNLFLIQLQQLFSTTWR